MSAGNAEKISNTCMTVVPPNRLGGLVLEDVVDYRTLPARLRGEFAQRPWPTHPLSERFVSPEFIPAAPDPQVPDGETWLFEIIEDQVVCVDGNKRGVRSNVLELLNLKLLTRDWGLTTRDFIALGFGRQIEFSKKSQAIHNARRRIQEKTAPHEAFDPNGSRNGVYRLHPAMRVVDLRHR